MRRFVEGVDRGQTTLFPECLEDWIGEDNPVRVVDGFVEELDLAELGFGGGDPEASGRPSYQTSILLKLYACEARCCAEFPGFGLLLASACEGALEVSFRSA